jgi:phage/plasmid-like protein (TIGR03299 family)
MTTVLENITKNTMVTARELPWMKLGKLVDSPMTASEAAELGGLNFTVERRPLWIGDMEETPESTTKSIPGQKIASRVALVNGSTGEMLSIVSKDYPILQYGEAFDFMDVIDPQYLAAGALKGGRQGFLVVQAPEYHVDILDGQDPHDLFVVLRTSHDCSRAVEAMIMPLRYKCMNQLTLQSFIKGVKHRWTVKHTSTMKDKLAEAQTALKNLTAYGEVFKTQVERLAELKVDDNQAKETLTFVLPDRPKRDDQIETIINAWHTSPTVGFDYTGWGLLNAVSEYFDWTRVGGSPESRFVGALQGSTHKAINQTANYLMTMV